MSELLRCGSDILMRSVERCCCVADDERLGVNVRLGSDMSLRRSPRNPSLLVEGRTLLPRVASLCLVLLSRLPPNRPVRSDC